VTNDHQEVATRAASDPELSRYHVLLDEEILPRLERPGRYVGPFEVRGIAPRSALTRFALLWPSMPESHHVPRELAPVKAALEAHLHHAVECASVPPADLSQALAERGLCLFTRPGWIPLSRFTTLAIWMEHPAQVLGLLSLLKAAGLPLAASARADRPRLLAGGPGAVYLSSLLSAWVDEVHRDPTADAFAAFVAAAPPADATRAAASPFLQPPDAKTGPAGPAPSAPNGGRAEAARPGGPVEERVRPLLAIHRQRPLQEIRERFGGARLTRLHLWAASEPLRRRLGLATGQEVIESVREALAHEARVLEIDLALGLPEETARDREAVVLLGRQLAEMAPRGNRQLRFRLHACLESSALPREEFERLSGALGRAQLKVQLSSPAEEGVVRALHEAGRDAAAVVESVVEAGVGSGDLDSAFSSGLWQAWRDPAAGADPPIQDEDPVEDSPTGLEDLPAIAGTLDANGQRVDAHRPKGARRDRWQRWSALVRGEHQLRVIYEKRGRARHLSHQETMEIFVEACRRGGLALAAAGVVSPRPKLNFGPPLPAGIEGLDEFVDLSLTHKTAGAAYALNEHLPEGLRVRWARYLPPGDKSAHARVEKTRYSVRLPHSLTAEFRAGVERFNRSRTWEIQRVKTDGNLTIDLKAQVTNVEYVEGGDGPARLGFDLDIVDSIPRARPYEVVAALIDVDAIDVRTIPLCRVSLLSRGGEPMGDWKTPRQLLELAVRKSRQAVKRFA